MKVSCTSERLKWILSSRGLKQIDLVNLAKPYCEKYRQKLGRNDVSQFISGKVNPGQWKLTILGLALNVSEAWLMGYDVPMERSEMGKDEFPFHSPTVTEDYTTFPVIGDIAVGYDSIAIEDWQGDTVDIPNSYLRGRNFSDFFVLRVKGDSMFPAYQEGDKVLILKQATLNYSGQVGAILYDGELATLKKVEYIQGEDWLRLVPINPSYPTKRIADGDLEHYRVIGIPKLLVREIEE